MYILISVDTQWIPSASMRQIFQFKFPIKMKDCFGDDDGNAGRSLSISQHGNFLSPPAFAADLSSTFPLHTSLFSRQGPSSRHQNSGSCRTNLIFGELVFSISPLSSNHISKQRGVSPPPLLFFRHQLKPSVFYNFVPCGIDKHVFNILQSKRCCPNISQTE